MQQAACSALLAAGSSAETCSALSLPALHKDVCLGCDNRSQFTSRLTCVSFSAVGNSTSGVLCPLGACNYGTGAMKTKNYTTNEYLEESYEGRSSVEVRSLCVSISFLQCCEDHLWIFFFLLHRRLRTASFCFAQGIPFHHPEKQLQQFCLSFKSLLSALLFSLPSWTCLFLELLPVLLPVSILPACTPYLARAELIQSKLKYCKLTGAKAVPSYSTVRYHAHRLCLRENKNAYIHIDYMCSYSLLDSLHGPGRFRTVTNKSISSPPPQLFLSSFSFR